VRTLPAALIGLAVVLTGCGARAGSHASPVPASSPTPPPVALTRWVNPAYPYAIGYPAGWKPVTANLDSVKFLGPSGRQISVDAQAVPDRQPPVNLPTYADQQVEALRRSSPDLVEIARNRIALPNQQSGVEVSAVWGPAATPHFALLLFVLDSGVGYTLRADAPASVSAADRRVLDAALRSFTLTPSD
jgi:hypothetical protein